MNLGAFLVVLALSARAEIVPPQVAGSFYPGSEKELRTMVEGFLAVKGKAGSAGEILGGLVPHAGYVYSGATAGRFYALLKGRGYRTVLILSTGHRRAVRGAATLAGGAMGTPLGSVEIDTAAVARLRAAEPLIEPVPAAFQGEHAVEVQLPFLQAALKKGFKVVPLLMNSDDPEVSRKVGLAVAKVLAPGKTLLIVSSDLSHYPNARDARTVDTASLAALVHRPDDPAYFWLANRALMGRGVPALDTTFCGEAGALAALFAMREVGGAPELLAYTNSGELPDADASRSVGYAAVLWAKGPVSARTPPLSGEQRKALLALARKTLSLKVEKGQDPGREFLPDPDFNLPEAVFVTLTRRDQPKGANLRGCIGSLAPDMALSDAVRYFAIQAALHDPRFPPVEGVELPKLRIEISRLSPFRKVKSHAQIKKGQGVVVRQGDRSGLFLPQVWDQLPDRDAFLGEVCEQKAHLPRDCWKDPKTEIQVFDDEAFQED